MHEIAKTNTDITDVATDTLGNVVLTGEGWGGSSCRGNVAVSNGILLSPMLMALVLALVLMLR